MNHYIYSSTARKRNPLLLIAGFAIIAGAGCHHPEETHLRRTSIVDAVFASGHIENHDQYTITANAEGFVLKTLVAEGDSVVRGQRLYQLENAVQRTQTENARTNLDFAKANSEPSAPQIQQLESQIAQARKKLAVDSTNYSRYARLVGSQAVSKSDFDNARLAYQNSQSALTVLEKNLADLHRNLNLNLANAQAQYQIQRSNDQYYDLTSQSGGIVMNVAKKAGDYVKKGEAIATLGAGSILIKLEIAEDDIGRVREGQPVLISLNSDKDKTLDATLTKVYPAFNTSEQAFIAEAEFKSSPGKVLNGTQLQANIIIQTRKDALVIPSYYLVNDDYVLIKGSKEKRKVSTGIRTLEWTEITGGINENDAIIAPNR